MKVFLPCCLASLVWCGAGEAHSGVLFVLRIRTATYCLKPTCLLGLRINYCVTVSASAGIVSAGKLVDFGHTLNKGCSPYAQPQRCEPRVGVIGTYCWPELPVATSARRRGLRAPAVGPPRLGGLDPTTQRKGPPSPRPDTTWKPLPLTPHPARCPVEACPLHPPP
uniref:Uncharacterized protein n=1 Tax=Ursus americanus TaxID=9643 RepID=A0A452QP17_URSAM